jgi:hypothetical protein
VVGDDARRAMLLERELRMGVQIAVHRRQLDGHGASVGTGPRGREAPVAHGTAGPQPAVLY